MATAFIIHGHDHDARDELIKCLKALELEIRPFHRARSVGITTSILETVITAITAADVVFVLFTPDEQASVFDPRTGELRTRADSGETLSGWQPRPNVIFEAGLAVGAAREKTALVRLGTIRPISDLDGVRYIDLTSSTAKEEIHAFVAERVSGVRAMAADEIEALPGDFSRWIRKRWEYYDELEEIQRQLTDVRLERSKRTMFGVLVEYVHIHPRESEWHSTEITDFFFHNYDYTKAQDATDGFFWNLMIHGVFAFKSIDGWDEGPLWWVNLQDQVYLTERGRALLKKVKARM